jgi:hypothetical protein
MLVALVLVLSFLGLLVVPPLFLASLVRMFAAQDTTPERDCRLSHPPAIPALRGHNI